MIKDLNRPGLLSGVLYGARLLQTADAVARTPRALQSAGAQALLDDLSGQTDGTGQSSKAHARGMMAAALTPQGRVGIDLEYRAPGRPILAIAHFLMGTPAPHEESAYRVFTFREAYFKAWGEWPERALLREVAASDALSYRLGADVNVLHEAIHQAFLLTLVWDGDRPAARAI
jgi:hypothetical protein